MHKLVVLTGAGMSAESGIRTFRDSEGLWEEHDVMTVASVDGWYANPQLVLSFYNDRRRQLETAKPNEGHKGLVELETFFDVQIITQNVDNMHERAGSLQVLHLHGELTKACSSKYPDYILDIGYKDINLGDKCPRGAQLRPYIVWFGEAVPAIEPAIEMVSEANALAVIGTSLNVYPAAGLLHYAPKEIPIYVIDPNEVTVPAGKVHFIKEKAGQGVQVLTQKLKAHFSI